jgi:hypothetical protein
MLSSTYLLIASSKLDVPFNLKLDFGLPSRFVKGFMVVMELTNNVRGIRALSNSLTLSFRIAFSFSISQIENFKDSPMNSWNSMTFEGGVGPRPSFEETFVRFGPLLDFDILVEEGVPRWS